MNNAKTKAERLQQIRAHFSWLGENRWNEQKFRELDDESEDRKTPIAHQRAWQRIAETVREP